MIIELYFIIKIILTPPGCNLSYRQIFEKANIQQCADCKFDSIGFGKLHNFCALSIYSSTSIEHNDKFLVWSSKGVFLGDMNGPEKQKVIYKMRLYDPEYFKNLQRDLEAGDED
jgi:hypothetical protein